MTNLRSVQQSPTSPRRKQGRLASLTKKSRACAAGWCVALVCCVGKLAPADDTAPADAVVVSNPTVAAAKAEMPDLAGLWRYSNHHPGDTFTKLTRAAVTDNFHYLQERKDIYPIFLRWIPDDQVFELFQKKDGDETHKSYLYRISPDGKTIRILSFVEGKVRKGVLDLIDDPKTTPELLKNYVMNTLHFVDRLQGSDFVIIETNEGLNAYSEKLDTWSRLDIARPKTGVPRLTEMVASAHFATVILDDQLLDYSSQAGRWGKLTIPPRFAGKVNPVHSVNSLTVQIGDTVYALSPKTGQWTSPEGNVAFAENNSVRLKNALELMSKRRDQWMARRIELLREEALLKVIESQPNEENPKLLEELIESLLSSNPEVEKLEQQLKSTQRLLADTERTLKSDHPVLSKIREQVAVSTKSLDETRKRLRPGVEQKLKEEWLARDETTVKNRKSRVDLLRQEEQAFRREFEALQEEAKQLGAASLEQGESPSAAELTTRMFQLKDADVEAYLRILKEIYPHLRAGADVSKNALVVAADEPQLEKITEVVRELERLSDETKKSSKRPKSAGEATRIDELRPDDKTPSARQIKVFPLANSDAGESARLIKDLFPAASAVSDARTNTVIVTSDEEELGRIQAVLLRLDEPSDPATIPIRKGLGFLTKGRAPNSPAAQRLAGEIARHEAEAVELAKQIRNRSLSVGKNHPDQVEGRAKLQNALAAALELKFQLEQLQVEELRTRLSQLEQQIGQRKALQQKIIDRRAEELIEGEATQWDSEESRVGRGSASPTDSAPSPVGLEDSSHPTTPTVQSKATEEVVTRSDSEPTGTSPIDPNKMRVTLEIERSYSHLFALDCDGSEHTWPATLQLDHDPQRIRSYPLQLVGQWPVPSNLALGTLEIFPHKDAEVDPLHVVFQITADDFNQMKAGNDVLKIFYVTDAKHQELAVRRIEMLASTRLDPKLDAIAEADKRGTILAVLRLSTRPRLASEPTPDIPARTEQKSSTPRPDESSLLPIPSYQDLVAKLEQVRDRVESAKSSLAKMEENDLPNIKQRKKALEQALRAQDALHQEYRAIIRDLEYQTESGQLAVAEAKAKLDRAEKLFEKRVMTELERNEIQGHLKQALLMQERLQNRLELYRQAGEQYGVSAPKLSEIPAFDDPKSNDLSTAETLSWDRLGLKLRPLNSSEQKLTGPKYRGGLRITQIKTESPADVAGLRENDILVGLGKWETVSPQNVTYVLGQLKSERSLKFYVMRGTEVMFGNFELRDHEVVR